MLEITEAGKKYIELKEDEKVLKKDVIEINEYIKKYFEETNTFELPLGDKKITKSVQDRSTMNEEKLLEKMKLMGMDEAIVLKETVDVEVVNDLIYKGKLSAADIADCVNPREVVVIRISNNK